MILPAGELTILGIPGLPEIACGDSLPQLIARAMKLCGMLPQPGDIIVVAQKAVSKAEGRTVLLDSVRPSERAMNWAAAHGKDARVVEIVLGEAKRIVRMERGLLIAETHHGFICANAGVDESNSAPGQVTLLPQDPDESARRLKDELDRTFQCALAVIVSDTFGRPWREGLVNVALGVAGFSPLLDYRGTADAQGRTLRSTVMAVADELASAAELVMGKARGIPVAAIRGFVTAGSQGAGRDLVRPAERDLFR